MSTRGDHLYMLHPAGFKSAGGEPGGPLYVFLVFRQSADAWNAKEIDQLAQEALLVRLNVRVGSR
jgi:hypothetical protein